jgi:radical SAM-linked protein
MSSPDVMPTPTAGSARHRITFATSRTLAYLSVLELGKLWERTLRRGHVPLKYSQGFNPRPRMHFAAPLPVGCGCGADLLDLSLDESWTSQALRDAIADVMPQNLVVLDATAVDVHARSLSDLLQEAEYSVWLQQVSEAELAETIVAFLEKEEILMPKRGRKYRGKLYDLRPLVKSLSLDPTTPPPWLGLHMRVMARPGATGRPDELLRALGLADLPRRSTRTRLILDSEEPAAVTMASED